MSIRIGVGVGITPAPRAKEPAPTESVPAAIDAAKPARPEPVTNGVNDKAKDKLHKAPTRKD